MKAKQLNHEDLKINTIKSPDYVGCYRLSGLSVFYVKKPKWLHRKLMAICLGWEWIDNELDNK